MNWEPFGSQELKFFISRQPRALEVSFLEDKVDPIVNLLTKQYKGHPKALKPKAMSERCEVGAPQDF